MIVAAHAKLTLNLRVTGVRDDGYHLIDAEMASLAIADSLSIAERTDGESSLRIDGTYAGGIDPDADNLVMKALRLVGRHADVVLTKNIPHGGGLGGGSADAAAILRWASFHDFATASRIGADIPFCMVDTARLQNLGCDRLTAPRRFCARRQRPRTGGFGGRAPTRARTRPHCGRSRNQTASRGQWVDMVSPRPL